MTESEYKQLSQFQNLPLYDELDPQSGSLQLPGKADPDGAAWLTLHEATDLTTAKAYLQNGKLVPKGGIRYWSNSQTDFAVFAYFWEKK